MWRFKGVCGLTRFACTRPCSGASSSCQSRVSPAVRDGLVQIDNAVGGQDVAAKHQGCYGRHGDQALGVAKGTEAQASRLPVGRQEQVDGESEGVELAEEATGGGEVHDGFAGGFAAEELNAEVGGPGDEQTEQEERIRNGQGGEEDRKRPTAPRRPARPSTRTTELSSPC